MGCLKLTYEQEKSPLKVVYGGLYASEKTVQRWTSTDPKNQYFSPYVGMGNNPVTNTDPDGGSTRPVYDTEGSFLGTDETGLQGSAVIMEAKNFKQNMSSEMSNKYDLGEGALKSDAARINFQTHFAGLEFRPDYDGIITDQEAREWWKSNCGKPLYVDISQLNLDPLNTYDFNGSTPKRYNFFLTPFSDSRTARVHGTLTMRLKNSSTGEVGFFRDQNGYFDTYDFNSDGRLTRDATTWFARTFVVGNGTGFGFIPYGKNPRVLVAAPLILQGP
jgi:hypothetical protein